MRTFGWACLAGWVVVLTVSAIAPAVEPSWTQWRGPQRDGIARETGLLKQWDEKGPPLLWKSAGLGSGYASITISNGRIFTMGAIQKLGESAECLIAVSDKDGSMLWSTRAGNETRKDGPRSTPTVDGDRVYAISTKGQLVCCRVDTGDIVWEKNFAADFGGAMMSGWGFCESPLIDGDKLICTPGGNDGIIVALSKTTGDLVWKSKLPNIGGRGKDGAGYSSIVISQACGVKQYVQMIGRGVISVRADDGTFLWGYNRVANGTANISTPIVDGDHIFCSTGYQTGAALLKIVKVDGDTLKAEEVYFLDAKTLQNHHGGMVRIGDYIYAGHGHNNGFPICIEMKTGNVVWRQDRGPGRESAAIVAADGMLYFRYQSGVMALIEATPTAYNLKGTFDIPNARKPSWAHPVVSNGKLYLREQDELFVYNIAAKK